MVDMIMEGVMITTEGTTVDMKVGIGMVVVEQTDMEAVTIVVNFI